MSEKVVEPGTIPMNITDKFTPSTPEINTVLGLTGVIAGTKMKSIWIGVDVVEKPNVELATLELELKAAHKKAHFSVKAPKNGWPPGNYKINIFINNELATVIPFQVIGDKTVQSTSPEKNQTGQKTQPNFVGNWQCQTMSGPASLIFHSQSQLSYNGMPYNYIIAQGIIQLQSAFGFEDYSYIFKDSTLFLVTPMGEQLQCGKMGEGMQAQQQQGIGGQEIYLQGNLCSWSGSSYGDVHTSSTLWAYFDGKGNLSYGSSSSVSGDAGLAYSPDTNSGSKGKYRVQGNNIQFVFPDGSIEQATVHNRQNDGRITEFKYEGKLYGSSLCK